MTIKQETNVCAASKSGRSPRLLSGLLLALTVLSSPVNAASIPLDFTVTATSVDTGVSAIVIGDQFMVNLIVDDSVVDTNVSVGAGTFPGLVTSFSMTATPGNVGSWTPSGTFNLPGSNFVTNAFGNGFTFQVIGSGFPNGGTSLAFQDIDHSFGWPPGITDSGSGDTFAQQLGTPFGVPPATFRSFSIRFTDGLDFPSALFAVTMKNATAPVPIPALGLFGLLALALALAWFGWRKRAWNVSA